LNNSTKKIDVAKAEEYALQFHGTPIQNIKELTNMKDEIKLELKHGVSDRQQESLDQWQIEANQYTATIKYKGKQMTTPFFTGKGWTKDPEIDDVMPALLSDYDVYQNWEFEDFCSEFGYDSDSRKAEKIFKACQKNGKAVERVFGFDAERLYDLFG
jgi:hypothetical protein